MKIKLISVILCFSLALAYFGYSQNTDDTSPTSSAITSSEGLPNHTNDAVSDDELSDTKIEEKEVLSANVRKCFSEVRELVKEKTDSKRKLDRYLRDEVPFELLDNALLMLFRKKILSWNDIVTEYEASFNNNVVSKERRYFRSEIGQSQEAIAVLDNYESLFEALKDGRESIVLQWLETNRQTLDQDIYILDRGQQIHIAPKNLISQYLPELGKELTEQLLEKLSFDASSIMAAIKSEVPPSTLKKMLNPEYLDEPILMSEQGELDSLLSAALIHGSPETVEVIIENTKRPEYPLLPNATDRYLEYLVRNDEASAQLSLDTSEKFQMLAENNLFPTVHKSESGQFEYLASRSVPITRKFIEEMQRVGMKAKDLRESDMPDVRHSDVLNLETLADNYTSVAEQLSEQRELCAQ